MATSSPTSGRLRFGVFEIDLSSGELWHRGNRLRLQDQPFQVLRVLLERSGRIVTREELRQAVWPADTFVDFDHGLNTAIKKIRDILGDSAEKPRYIETIPRRGYRFIYPTESPESTQDAEKAAALIGQLTSAPTSAEAFISPKTARRAGSAALGVLALVAVLVGVDIGGWRSRTRVGATEQQIQSLAVLPLKNLSGDPGQEYFADAMTESLIGRLSMIRGLRVSSRTSAMQFKDTRLSAPEIAKTLHVDALVEGSVIRDGGRIRVHAQLIRGATDEHFWSETYDRELKDVLGLQSEVAQAIAEKVQVTITGAERERLTAARQVAPEVYESFLKGVGAFNEGYSRAVVEKSIGYFEEAIRKDPTFAPAYLGLAGAYDQLGTPGIGGAPPNEVRPKVIGAVRKALELDPSVSGGHVFLAAIYQEQWKWSEAETEYKRALELSPNDAGVHSVYSNWLLCQGRTEEALATARHAREMDPFAIDGGTIGWIQFHARHYEEAIRELRSSIAVHPNDASNYWFLGFALIANNKADEAIPELEKAVTLSERSPDILGLLANAYAHVGRRAEALRILDELKQKQQKGYVPTPAFVFPYLGLGDKEQAFVWLERAYQEQSPLMQYLKVHPLFDPIRGDPRFKDLVRRVGLDERL